MTARTWSDLLPSVALWRDGHPVVALVLAVVVVALTLLTLNAVVAGAGAAALSLLVVPASVWVASVYAGLALRRRRDVL